MSITRKLRVSQGGFVWPRVCLLFNISSRVEGFPIWFSLQKVIILFL